MYISQSFLRFLSQRADRKAALILLIVLLPFLAFCLFMAVYAGLSFAILGLPSIILMLVPFYLPCALTTKEETSVRPGNILFRKNPLETVSLALVRNWVYFLYALFPALNIILIVLNKPGEEEKGGYVYLLCSQVCSLEGFAYIFSSIYLVFLLLALILGKLHLLKLGGVILSMAVGLLILLTTIFFL